MTDIFSKEKRSEIMSKIHTPTKIELIVKAFLKDIGVPFVFQPKLPMRPDFFIPPNRVIFVDGCFWHRCPIHFRMPKTNIEFWDRKIKRNVERRGKRREILDGYDILEIWEHSIRDGSFKKIILDWLGK